MPLEVSLTNEEQVRVTATPTTTTGRPARLDGALRASTLSGDGTTAAGSSDLEVILRSGDAPGDSSFLIEGDADLGEGVVLVQDTVTMHVAGSQAAALGLTVGTPEAKP